MKKFYCETCNKLFRNGELFCDTCGQELKPEKILSKKKLKILCIIVFLLIVVITIYSVATKDNIRFPGRLDSEAQSVLNNEEQHIVNSFVESIIDSYNEGNKSNNYFKWSVCSGNLYESYEEMVENFGYYAVESEELNTLINLLTLSNLAYDIEYASSTGMIDGVESTPEEIRDYIKNNINTILNNLYY